MEELKMTPKELSRIMYNVDVIGKGYYGVVFEYNGKLIKMDKKLCNLFEKNLFKNSDELFKEYSDDFYFEQFVDLEQIEHLSDLQDKIKLTKMPQGVVKMNDMYTGIILTPHYNHIKLNKFPKGNYKELLLLLRNLLLEVRELEDNGILHTDLKRTAQFSIGHEYNILYKDVTPQLIDLDGYLVRYKDINSYAEMYQQLAEIIIDFFNLNNIRTDLKPYYVNDANDISEMLDELEYKTRGM